MEKSPKDCEAKSMKKIMFAVIAALLLNLSLVNAITQQEIGEAKSLIDSKSDCKSLSGSQLEIIGEYYMEQMHPGEAHELMDKMMGGEGSESLRRAHTAMAKRLYCNEDAGGMTGSGGMTGMAGNWNYFGYWNFTDAIYAILLIGLTILVYLWIIKSWKSIAHKGGRK
ncbi:MAG: hypothetical protein WC602_01005 [archaeon]